MRLNVNLPIPLSDEERTAIISAVQEEADRKGEKVAYINIWEDGGELCYQPFFERKIKRIRRITGYLSETKNFNDAKKAELKDRINHAM